MSGFFIQLLGTREGWPAGMTEDETRAMEAHYVYLRALVWQGRCLFAGPVMATPPFGLVLLDVDGEAAARAIMDAEPSVVAGVHTYTLTPMVPSLLAGRQRFAALPGARAIVREVDVPVPRAEAWRAWTTPEGLASFFCPRVKMELRVGGPFEILFNAEVPEGESGSEGCTVLAHEPERMLAISWNAPPQFPSIRRQRTQVVLTFSDAPAGCHVRLSNHGYGVGEDWDAVFAYFERAWGFVMDNFAKTMAGG